MIGIFTLSQLCFLDWVGTHLWKHNSCRDWTWSPLRAPRSVSAPLAPWVILPDATALISKRDGVGQQSHKQMFCLIQKISYRLHSEGWGVVTVRGGELQRQDTGIQLHDVWRVNQMWRCRKSALPPLQDRRRWGLTALPTLCGNIGMI